MSANAFAIARDLAEKGAETADAAAAIVTRADDSRAAKISSSALFI